MFILQKLIHTAIGIQDGTFMISEWYISKKMLISMVSFGNIFVKKDFHCNLICSQCEMYLYDLDRIRPVCLPITDDLINRRFVNFNAFLVGWGRTSENATSSPIQIPNEVQVPVIENKLCKEIYFRINSTMFQKDSQFDDRVICEGFTKGGKSSCQGD